MAIPTPPASPDYLPMATTLVLLLLAMLSESLPNHAAVSVFTSTISATPASSTPTLSTAATTLATATTTANGTTISWPLAPRSVKDCHNETLLKMMNMERHRNKGFVDRRSHFTICVDLAFHGAAKDPEKEDFWPWEKHQCTNQELVDRMDFEKLKLWHTRSWHDGVAKADAADDDDNVSSLLALCLLYVEYHTERRSRRIWHRFHSLVRTLISPLALYVGATVAILMLGVCIRWVYYAGHCRRKRGQRRRCYHPVVMLPPSEDYLEEVNSDCILSSIVQHRDEAMSRRSSRERSRRRRCHASTTHRMTTTTVILPPATDSPSRHVQQPGYFSPVPTYEEATKQQAKSSLSSTPPPSYEEATRQTHF